MKNLNVNKMTRRDALALTSAILGVAIIGSSNFLSSCKSANNSAFTENDLKLMDEIGETILPETEKSGGAKKAGIGNFMKKIVTDCYSEQEQTIFKNGLKKIEEDSQSKYNKSFIALNTEQKLSLLNTYDILPHEKAEDDGYFFSMIKQLTIWGYFSSEVGATQALHYEQIPGRYLGCADYKVGDKAWY